MKNSIKQWVYNDDKGIVGLMYAMSVDDNTYAVNISLVNPGREVVTGKRVGYDKFDKNIAEKMVVAKIAMNDPLPKIVTRTPNTRRAKAIYRQFNNFIHDRAPRFFKGKSMKIVSA